VKRPPPDVRVLIVDDETRLRDVLARAIASWGFTVSPARGAAEALHLMRSGRFDIAILDLNLPGMDGIELFGKLREIHPDIQVIVLTGFGNLDVARASIRLDVVDFLEKPCPLGELEQSLHRATQRVTRELPTPELGPDAEPDEKEEEPPAAVSAQEQGLTLEEVERDHIISTLRRHDGNRTATALELGISRRTLQYKLSEYQRQGFAVDG
jgi:DNA-binding NtrC family response regulator